jgi:hypothetical protein
VLEFPKLAQSPRERQQFQIPTVFIGFGVQRMSNKRLWTTMDMQPQHSSFEACATMSGRRPTRGSPNALAIEPLLIRRAGSLSPASTQRNAAANGRPCSFSHRNPPRQRHDFWTQRHNSCGPHICPLTITCAREPRVAWQPSSPCLGVGAEHLTHLLGRWRVIQE